VLQQRAIRAHLQRIQQFLDTDPLTATTHLELAKCEAARRSTRQMPWILQDCGIFDFQV